ncbi:MAG: hypothetical protein QOC77_743 [Thermoleophilaceae bacterium]|nr:hypothetical protein [Thermoleophilaceae bacterium]
MPVATAGLADVGVRDAGEPVLLGLEQHLLACAPGELLALTLGVELPALRRSEGGKPVALPFEAGETEHRGPAAKSVDRRCERDSESRKVAVESRDLLAQRATRRGLADQRRLQKLGVDRHRHVNHQLARSG